MDWFDHHLPVRRGTLPTGPSRMSKKKPDDETLKAAPAQRHDSFVGPTALTSSALKAAAVAPEVSQGAWRERVFTPRAVMARTEINLGLLASVRVVLATASHPRSAFDVLKPAWRPLLRQALEQAGGDGVDHWLSLLFAAPVRSPKAPLFVDLAEALLRLRLSRDVVRFEEAALKTVEVVEASLSQSPPAPLSFQQMERQLEGKLEVDELLFIRAGTSEELIRRLQDIANTMDQLRQQLLAMPGKQPGGMYGNFVRLKAELKVLDAELKRRAG
jgi:hypothetical protein